MRDFLSWIKSARNLFDRTINMIISYLQFFHMYVLHKPWDRRKIAPVIKSYLTTIVDKEKAIQELQVIRKRKFGKKKMSKEDFEEKKRSVFLEKTRLYEQYKMGTYDRSFYFKRKGELDKKLGEIQTQSANRQ